MALDFSLLGTGQTVDTVLAPRDIFNALPNKSSGKFQYPRDVQSQVWAKWFERRREQNLVLKLNTGGGKTLVGLLILKSCLNEKVGTAVYVVPDNYLVGQVAMEAQALGLLTTDDPRDPRFLTGRAILISNVHKLVNGKSVFGVGDDGVKIPIGGMVVDDAHACLGTIEQQFTVNISSSNPAYNVIYSIFKESLRSQCESKFYEIESGDPLAYAQVPYWNWQDKLGDVTRALVDAKRHDEIQFNWPLIKDGLKYCNCVISGNGIEISLDCLPIDSLPAVSSAQRRIFMTATLADDSVLATHFGVPAVHLSSPITPETAGDVGDRLILLPQALNTSMSDDDVKKVCSEVAKLHNVVVIVPSLYRANYWSDVSRLVLTRENIYEGVGQLKSNHVGLTVLVNRYDGVDLPDNSCRLLVIDGLPDARSKIDRVRQAQIRDGSFAAIKLMQTIEQGMGRGIRSNDDFCVVFLMGKELTSQLYLGKSKDYFSPSTRAQLNLSEQVAEQISGGGESVLKEAMNYCLNRSSEWVTASRGVLASLSFHSAPLNRINVALREAFDCGMSGQPENAAQKLQNVLNECDGAMRPLLQQWMAAYVNQYDKLQAQEIQISAVTANSRLLKPIAGIKYSKLISSGTSQEVLCSTNLSKFSDSNAMVMRIDSILGNLAFAPNSANRFEQAMRDLADVLGFLGQRPENDFGKGPDVLWVLGGQKFFVIECKNEAVAERISKTYCNQLNGSISWFRRTYPGDGECKAILIHPSTIFEYAASPDSSMRIINEDMLKKLTQNVREFISSVKDDSKFTNTHFVGDRLRIYNLTPDKFFDTYTVGFKVHSS